jgi:hypothetical protein
LGETILNKIGSFSQGWRNQLKIVQHISPELNKLTDKSLVYFPRVGEINKNMSSAYFPSAGEIN